MLKLRIKGSVSCIITLICGQCFSASIRNIIMAKATETLVILDTLLGGCNCTIMHITAELLLEKVNYDQINVLDHLRKHQLPKILQVGKDIPISKGVKHSKKVDSYIFKFGPNCIVAMVYTCANRDTEVVDIRKMKNLDSGRLEMIVLWIVGEVNLENVPVIFQEILRAPVFAVLPKNQSIFFACITCQGVLFRNNKDATVAVPTTPAKYVKAPFVNLPFKGKFSDFLKLWEKHISNLRQHRSSQANKFTRNSQNKISNWANCNYQDRDDEFQSNICLCVLNILYPQLNCTSSDCRLTVFTWLWMANTRPILTHIRIMPPLAFSPQIIIVKQTIFIRKEENFYSVGSSVLALLQPFQYMVHLTVIFTIFVTPIMFITFKKLLILKAETLEMIFWAVDSLLEKSCKISKYQTTGTIVILVAWLFAGIVIRTLYTANVYAFISKPSLPDVPQNMTETLRKANEFKLVTTTTLFNIMRGHRDQKMKNIIEHLFHLNYEYNFAAIKNLSENKPTKLFSISRRRVFDRLNKFSLLIPMNSLDDLPEVLPHASYAESSTFFAILTFGNRLAYPNKKETIWRYINLWRVKHNFLSKRLNSMFSRIVDTGVLAKVEMTRKQVMLASHLKKALRYVFTNSKFYNFYTIVSNNLYGNDLTKELSSSDKEFVCGSQKDFLVVWKMQACLWLFVTVAWVVEIFYFMQRKKHAATE